MPGQLFPKILQCHLLSLLLSLLQGKMQKGIIFGKGNVFPLAQENIPFWICDTN
jgi:hypothetical protein